MTHTPKIESFSKPASDLFKIAVQVAGFNAMHLMAEIHRHAPRKATVRTVEQAMRRLKLRAMP